MWAFPTPVRDRIVPAFADEATRSTKPRPLLARASPSRARARPSEDADEHVSKPSTCSSEPTGARKPSASAGIASSWTRWRPASERAARGPPSSSRPSCAPSLALPLASCGSARPTSCSRNPTWRRFATGSHGCRPRAVVETSKRGSPLSSQRCGGSHIPTPERDDRPARDLGECGERPCRTAAGGCGRARDLEEFREALHEERPPLCEGAGVVDPLAGGRSSFREGTQRGAHGREDGEEGLPLHSTAGALAPASRPSSPGRR